MHLPDTAPSRVEPFLRGLIDTLGSLVPAGDAARIVHLWGDLPLLKVGSIGLEITLPPDPAACDASVLLAPGAAPPGLEEQDDLLGLLLEDASRNHDETVWWELDSSQECPRMATFWRTREHQPTFERLRAVIADRPDLTTALDALEPWYRRWNAGAPGLVGVFPSRDPAAAGLLMPIKAEHVDAALERLSHHGICVSPMDPRVQLLRQNCTSVSLALGADEQGRLSVSFEAAFLDRENAMLRGDWDRTLADATAWGCPPRALEALLDTQGHRRYDVFPPLSVLTGIDHIKVGPGGRTKAYVGVLPLGAAVLNEVS